MNGPSPDAVIARLAQRVADLVVGIAMRDAAIDELTARVAELESDDDLAEDDAEPEEES